jgi:Arc/MetJ family transcription regulator
MLRYVYTGGAMPGTLTSIRLDTKLADEAKRALGAKSRTEAVHIALKEIVRLNRFKKLMNKYGGKLAFENYDK